MYLKVLDTIEKNNLISPGDYVVAGLSGGADSVVLLHVLNKLKDKLNFRLLAVHVNHMIRGEEAVRDQDFSVELCAEMGVEIEVIKKDCVAFAKEHKLSLEESARILRYEAFKACAEKRQNSKIAVAHNENDNAETMLMRMLRGTSAYGLRGMDILNGNTIRPLLCCTREEIEDYAAKNKLNFITDSSNADLNYTRNKIRKSLLPLLQKEYNPNILNALGRLSSSLKSDADYFNNITEKAYNKYTKTGPGWIIISNEAFIAEHEAVTSRIIRLCVKNLNGSDKDFDNIHMTLTAGLLNLRSGKKLSLSSGLFAANCFGDIAIYKPRPAIEEIPLSLNKFIEIDHGSYISTSHEKINCRENFTNTCTGVFICDKMTDSLVIRGRRDGDLINNSKGKAVKFKDFLIRKDIPVFLRDSIYLVASGSSVLMVLSDINYVPPENESTNKNKNLYIQLWRKNNG